jgi:single-stranded-DNA-specific exonuclease
MLHNKLWVCNEVSDKAAVALAKESGISVLMAKVFLSRGIEDTEYIKSFLNPSLDGLNDPFLMKDMDKAVDRIIKAIDNKEKIIIYGDYDVDGITSTSILVNFLCSLKADVEFFIPDRVSEGYGLSVDTIFKLLTHKPSLIITVDCGITSFDEVEYINKNNIDIIITDHHECREELPDAYAVINPLQRGCSYPYKELAGVGIAFKVINALCKKLQLGNAHYAYLDLAAIGTVADVVPLTGENRIIVKYGLPRIKDSSNVGVMALVSSCGLKVKPITSWAISFILAPRINAAGRIGDARRAVKLFTTADLKEAEDIVLTLNDENKFRQDTEAEIHREVLEKIDKEVDLCKEKVIVVIGEEWHHGVIGIVSSKITEKFNRPCILLSHESGICKGSGRSIEGFNLFKALNHLSELLENFGGHELAAGLSIRYENFERFKKMINQYAEAVFDQKDMIPKIKVDVRINRDDISINNIKELDKLAPFGAGNPCPVFSYDKIRVSDIKTVGESKHLKIRLEDSSFSTEAIGFNMGSLANSLSTMDILDVAFSLEINNWNNIEKIQMNLKDLRHNDEIIMEKQYYYSLDKCVGFCCGGYDLRDKEPVNLNSLSKAEELIDLVKADCKVIILVNALESAKKLKTIFKKHLSGIKKYYSICFTCLEETEPDTVYIVINPDTDGIDFNCFDRVIFYGSWIDPTYLNLLAEKIKDKNCLFLLDNKGIKRDEIIPERRDMVAVYQYLKANAGLQLEINDLFVLAREIAASYKINMNYFKLKKCIDILEELRLLEKEALGQYGLVIRFSNTVKEKTCLEKSSLYRMFQLLKTELIE